MISFHQLHHSPNEQEYISRVLAGSQWSGGGDGEFARLCKQFLRNEYGFTQAWLTTSCTAALEAAALLLQLKPGDEIILPSYTYVGTASPFARAGARLVFADSRNDHPNMSLQDAAAKITSRTKAIVLVHYGGVAHDLEKWADLAREKNIYLIEDAAHGIHSFYKGKPLGSFGHISAFSFHATKNISCGEGGMLVVNDEKLIQRAGIIMQKGTNRDAFQRGEVQAYEWVDHGSSFVLSEILCALLLSQLEMVKEVTQKRIEVWDQLYAGLKNAHAGFILPQVPAESNHNAHVFFMHKPDMPASRMIARFKDWGIQAMGHYQALHQSRFITQLDPKNPIQLPNAELFTESLVRIPCHGMLNPDVVNSLINSNLISI